MKRLGLEAGGECSPTCANVKRDCSLWCRQRSYAIVGVRRWSGVDSIKPSYPYGQQTLRLARMRERAELIGAPLTIESITSLEDM